MIFFVDKWGIIAVAGADFLRTCSDSTMQALLATQTWCFSMVQASAIARERRARRKSAG